MNKNDRYLTGIAILGSAILAPLLSKFYDIYEDRKWVSGLKDFQTSISRVMYLDKNNDLAISVDDPSDGLLHQDRDGLVDRVYKCKRVKDQMVWTGGKLVKLDYGTRKQLFAKHKAAVLTHLVNNASK